MSEDEEREEELIKKAFGILLVKGVDKEFLVPTENLISKVTNELYANPGSVRDIMSLMIDHFPIEEIKKKIQQETEQESKKKEEPFLTIIKELNQNLIKFNNNIGKVEKFSETILDPSKNNVDVMWDELEYFMKDDKDYKIEKIEGDKIIIKALRKEAFLNAFIMAKIFGKILPYNCKFILNTKDFRGRQIKEDLLIYDFLILTESNFYKGIVFIKFQED